MAQRLSYFSLARNQQMMIVARVGLLSAGDQLTIYVATPKMLQERGRWHRGDGCHGDPNEPCIGPLLSFTSHPCPRQCMHIKYGSHATQVRTIHAYIAEDG